MEDSPAETVGACLRSYPATIDVAYEDADLMVVVKPAGMVSHPAYRHANGTLWNALVEMFALRGLGDRPHLLHRLDRATSGLLCVPKHAAAHRSLERSMRRGSFDKRYLALVRGMPPVAGMIEAPLGRDPANTRQVCVREDGQPARTRFRVIKRFPGYTLLRVTLETGRMHQIRVHLKHIGHPVVGDTVYGTLGQAADLSREDSTGGHMHLEAARLFLHADRLVFPHPVHGDLVRCKAPLPSDLRGILGRLQ